MAKLSFSLALLTGMAATILQVARAEDHYGEYVRTSRDFKPVNQDPARFTKPWERFLYMPWPFKWTIGFDDAAGKWALEHGYNGAVVNRDGSPERFAWINKFQLGFYVDHLAGKGLLHQTEGKLSKAEDEAIHQGTMRLKPINAALIEELKRNMRINVAAAKASPYRAGYALDDEPSWGHYVHPAMWQITDDKTAYPKWLKEIYGPDAPTREKWVNYDDIRPKLSEWSIADFDASPLMDEWTFNDSYWNNLIGDLVEYANELDPGIPCGYVGGQTPSPFGGFDYAKQMRKVQFIEASDVTEQPIVQSFNPHDALAVVTTDFFRSADYSVWSNWHAIAHGVKGRIAWVNKWFDGKQPLAWHEQVAPQLLDVEKVYPLLAGATWRPGVAIYYSQPSIQLGWIFDAQPHGKSWTGRNRDYRIGSPSLVRLAWEEMLTDEGLQFQYISYVDAIQKGIPPEVQCLVLPGCLCLSDAEAEAIRKFVAGGGTVIADYLPGLWDEHGKGRKSGGALDDLFGVKHDSAMKAADVFNGRDDLWTEVDQEANFGYKTYDDLLLKKNSCIKDPSGYYKAVRKMDTAKVNRLGKGTAVLMNLSPQMYNLFRVAGDKPAEHRHVFMQYVPNKPQAIVRGEGTQELEYETCTWRQPSGRSLLFVLSKPRLTIDDFAAGQSPKFQAATVPVRIELPAGASNIRDERSGKPLAAGKPLEFKWRTNEAILISFDPPRS